MSVPQISLPTLLQGAQGNAFSQLLGAMIGGAALSALPGQSGSGSPAAPDLQALATLAALAHLAQSGLPATVSIPQEPPIAPPKIPFALNVLGSVLPVMTFIYGIGLIAALAVGASVGQAQIGLVVALALILGVLLALTCAVVFWFVGSSLGSWSKNFRASATDAGGATGSRDGGTAPLPMPLPVPAPSSGPTTKPPPDPSPAVDNFPRVHAIIAKWEGGYSNDPRDKGGPTNYGITQADLAEWRGHAVTAADVQAMSYDEALKIFRARYWTPLRCADMQIAVALMTYNWGVNGGISRGASYLQQRLNAQGLGVDVDGEVGPLTLAAAAKADVKQLITDYAARCEAHYRSLDDFATFGKGWLNRLADVTAIAKTWATEPGAAPKQETEPVDVIPPWLARAVALLGLYEYSGDADNPVILRMAQACGGQIAATYKHDAIAWCALLVNYCLHAAGQPGDDSLLALDFASYGQKLSGPAVGAIASKKRTGGGHVFFVLGRSAGGRLVGVGGNQSDMVCEEEFDAEDIVAYTWPKDYPLPAKVGASMTDVSALPITTPAPKAHRDVELPA
jgi:uncharacterized protein (TIGR02594 family)